MRPAPERLRIFRTNDAAHLAGDLFEERFRSPFPVARHDAGLPIPTPPANWLQYVAQYRWPEDDETVAFCNFIRYGDVYLEGGLCVRESLYRRIPREEFAAIRERGGLGQMVMAHAAGELADGKAWFAHCGDGRAMAIGLRSGFIRTRHPHVIVKWFADVPEGERERLVDSIAAIGPF